jgi:hypothetical protein
MNLLLNYFLLLKFKMSNSALDYINFKILPSSFLKYDVVYHQ